MSFTEEHLSGRPDSVRRVFEAAGLSFRSARGAEAKALCPFHDDHTPSLSVNLEKGAYLCRACGASGDAVDFFAKQRNMSDTDAIAEIRKLLCLPLSGPRRATPVAASRSTKAIHYEIRDAAGELKATHLRTEGPDGKKIDGMPWEPKGIKTAELPLYGSERMAVADPEALVIVCEGEKATDSLHERSYVAVGSVTGASGTPGAAALEVLRGRDVVLWPDNDDVGRQHMRRVAAGLGGIARSVRVLEWGEQQSDDAFDFFARGGTIDQLDRLLAEAETCESRSEPDIEGGLPRWPTIPSVLASMPPPGERLTTGFATLDRCLRGGLASGRVYTFIGPPHRGKTALLSQLGLRFARECGSAVVGLYFDEGNWQAGLMMAEGVGFERVDLEDGYAAVRDRVESAVGTLRIWLPDPSDPNSALEDIEAGLVAGGLADQPVVIIADSIQRVRARIAEDAPSSKERTDAVMACLRQLVSRHPAWIVLAAAKANRGSWAKRTKGEEVDRMAAGLDSSAIEYDSDFLAFLDGRIDDGIELHVLKNRPGTGEAPVIHLQFDRRRASFAEVSELEVATRSAERERDADAARWSKWEELVLAYLATARSPVSTNVVRAKAKIGKNYVTAVLEGLETRGRVVRRDGKQNARLWALATGTEQEAA